MRKLRLLIVIDTMEVGGSQRQITRLLQGIDLETFECTLLFFRQPSYLSSAVQSAGTRTVHIPKRGRIDFRFLLQTFRFFRAETFDLIHTFSSTAELWTMVLRTGLHDAVLLGSIRDVYTRYSAREWSVKRRFTERARWVVSNSKMAGEFAFRKLGLPGTKLKIIRNGVSIPPAPDETECLQLRRSLGIAPDEIMALFVGRLVYQKNISSLVRAAALTRAENFRLVIVGDGPDREELCQQAAPQGDRVQLIGERRDVELLMQASDYVVLSSRTEAISNTLLEAMAAGKAVIATSVGGTPELVSHNENGLLYPSDDAEALAQNMNRLNGDSALRARLGSRGRQRAKSEFSDEAMIRAFQELYLESTGRA